MLLPSSYKHSSILIVVFYRFSTVFSMLVDSFSSSFTLLSVDSIRVFLATATCYISLDSSL